ncbi:MAG TPA: hypothetical protein DD670_20645 [Planctomycetaceae bacterium]|nr:hypothetical protein [Planctomycetaceae bacterium]
MKNLSWMFILAVLLAAVGCEQRPADRMPGTVTPEDVSRDASQAAETAVEYSKQAKEDFQKSLEVRIEQMDAKIATLREKGSELKDEAKVNWDRKMADLEAKRDAARAKLAEVGDSSGEAWKDVRDGAQSAWDELEKAFRDASQEF